jgi:aromatase
MIKHTLIYAFPPQMTAADQRQFFDELAEIMSSSPLCSDFRYGAHLPTASDARARTFVASAVAEITCADLADLSTLSGFPPLRRLTSTWHARFPYEVVWANTEVSGAAT